MRILSGRFRNTPIPFRPSPYLRPTPDKVRLAVMAVLADKIEGASVLDLFCGTGALGLEALSRGAKRVIFVEKHKPLISGLQALLAKLGETAGSRVIGSGAVAAMALLADAGDRFDIVLADPPYETGMGSLLLHDFDRIDILNDRAVVAVETRSTEVLPAETNRLKRAKSSTYGDTAVHYFLRKPREKE